METTRERTPDPHTPDPHTASPRLVSAGSAVIFLFITLPVPIRFDVLLKIQHVDLYDAYLLLFLTNTLRQNDIRTS